MLVKVGALGPAFTTAVVLVAVEEQPATVTERLYVPEAAVVALVMTGFCAVEVKAFGPVQLYVAPATVVEESVKFCPAHIGPPLEAIAEAGTPFTLTLRVA